MPAGTDHLAQNENLQHNQWIRSNNGIYQVLMQVDGNLVLYKNFPGTAAHALWSSKTNGKFGQSCNMQSDGNLVVYDTSGKAQWAAGTDKHPGSTCVIQDDGNFVIYNPAHKALWASNTVQKTVPGGPPASGTGMAPGTVLQRDVPLHSASGRYHFVFQGDSNLVLYKVYPNLPQKALWSSKTNGKPAVVCILQGDGNLVIYDSDAHALWAAGSDKHPNSHLTVQDDGNVVIYGPDNKAVWATNTVQAAVPSGPQATGATMLPGQVLHPGNSLNTGGRYRFIFQGDGNLVLYKVYTATKQVALWASNTAGKVVDVCIMQADGNLVLYDPDAHAVWSSKTNGHGGAHLILQPDGNTVIYDAQNHAQWATGTNAMLVHFKSLLPISAGVSSYLGQQYEAMDELYINGGINIARATTEDLSGDNTLSAYLSLDIGGCTLGSSTAEQKALFGHRNNCGSKDVVVYLVQTLEGAGGNAVGCAAHPDNVPACAIVMINNADWLTSHEVGHVLGLRHFSNSDYMMWTTVSWTKTPPTIDGGEFKTMRDSDLTPAK